MSTEIRRPNFFLIGAPKCGTTAMAQYLGEHPGIFMSYPKEPNYLADDLPEFRAIETEAAYLRLFEGTTARHQIVGEASVWYLYSDSAIEALKRDYADARLLLMLRHPIEFLISYHAQMLFSFHEDQDDIETAWRYQQDRSEGRRLPPRCRSASALNYRRALRFGDRLQLLRTTFPDEQLKCVLLEDFRQDPQAVFRDILAFLGVEDIGRTAFPVINAGRQHRSPVIGRLLLNPPPVVRTMWRGMKAVFGSGIIRGPETILTLLSTKAGATGDLDPGFQRLVLEAIGDDIGLLEELLGRDLPHWRQPVA